MEKTISSIFAAKPDKIASGLAAVSGYEPWPMRTIASMKESISQGIPLLARLHSAADYPTGSEQNDQRLDMESHAILLVGYDDSQETFDAVDPWNSEWNGAFSGRYKISYQRVYDHFVNCSADKVTRMALPFTKVRYYEVNRQRFAGLQIGYYRPRGYVLDELGSAFTHFEITADFGKSKQTREVTGRWHIGEYASLSFPIPDYVTGVTDIEFEVNAVVEGIRPYKFTDPMNYVFTEKLDVQESRNQFAHIDNSKRESI